MQDNNNFHLFPNVSSEFVSVSARPVGFDEFEEEFEDEFEDEEPTPAPKRPECLEEFDIEVVALYPLPRYYIFTHSAEEWEKAKAAVASLSGQISPLTFLQLEEKGKQLRGVYAKDLKYVLTGYIVEFIENNAYCLANSVES